GGRGLRDDRRSLPRDRWGRRAPSRGRGVCPPSENLRRPRRGKAGSSAAQEIDVVALEDFLVSLVEQGDAKTKDAAIALALEPRHLELRVDGVAEQDGLAEPAPLLDEGDHGGLETLGVGGGAEGGHRHDEEPVRDASAESRVAGIVLVVVDGMVVAR